MSSRVWQTKCLSFLRIADVTLDYWSPADETERESSRVRSDSQICGKDNWLTKGACPSTDSSRAQSSPIRLKSKLGVQNDRVEIAHDRESNKIFVLFEQCASKELYSDGQF